MKPAIDMELVLQTESTPKSVVGLEIVGALDKLDASRRHTHRKAQLLYTLRGVMHCEVANAVWVVPAHCAVWIPGGQPHATFGTGDVEALGMFFDPEMVAGLPGQCCTLSISPFSHELITRIAKMPRTQAASARDERLMHVLVDELKESPLEKLHLPIPSDPRLLNLMHSLLSDPADRSDIDAWAARIAMSRRTMTRRLSEELGISFGQWRRLIHVSIALRLLSAGVSVQQVSIDLGYESSSSFIIMFKKIVGNPPGLYKSGRT